MLALALLLALPPATVTVPPAAGDEAAGVPERFRLPPGAFAVTVAPRYDLSASRVRVWAVAFPSAVQSPHPENNAVVGEYFEPYDPDPAAPAVLVLDILDGAGVVSRGEAVWLAARGVPALCLTMPYYGPRRPAGSKLRLLSANVPASLDNMRQAVLDGRRGLAWLATRPEGKRLGVVGTSLGSFLGALVAAAEPKVGPVCLLLGGGGLVDAYALHPKAVGAFRTIEGLGLPRSVLRAVVAPVDPLTYAPRLKAKSLLLIGASRDDVVPPAALTALWKATGEPKLVWFDATHVGAAAFGFRAMREVIDHLKAPPEVPKPGPAAKNPG